MFAYGRHMVSFWAWRLPPNTCYGIGKNMRRVIVFLADIMGPDLLIVVLVIVVLLFGGAAIPKLARNLGQAKSEF